MSFNLPFIGGNWKMNHGPTEARAFVDTFSKLYEPADDRTVVFFPPAISITEFSRAAARRLSGCTETLSISQISQA